FARLPEISSVRAAGRLPAGVRQRPAWKYPQLILGFFAIFCSVGLEVVSGDTIGNYGLYQGIRLDVAKTLTSYSLASGIIGYLAGVFLIPKFISQEKAYVVSNFLGVFITLMAILSDGVYSVIYIALLNLANALLWPAVWPQALKGLRGDMVNKASAILIMGIAGGALMPLLYGWAARFSNNQAGYWTLIPFYIYGICYWW